MYRCMTQLNNKLLTHRIKNDIQKHCQTISRTAAYIPVDSQEL